MLSLLESSQLKQPQVVSHKLEVHMQRSVTNASVVHRSSVAQAGFA
jgi:hypothetical protein